MMTVISSYDYSKKKWKEKEWYWQDLLNMSFLIDVGGICYFGNKKVVIKKEEFSGEKTREAVQEFMKEKLKNAELINTKMCYIFARKFFFFRGNLINVIIVKSKKEEEEIKNKYSKLVCIIKSTARSGLLDSLSGSDDV